MRFFLDYLLISQQSVSLHRVFHSIRFKVNKGWSKALLLFFMSVLHLLPKINVIYLKLFSTFVRINTENHTFKPKRIQMTETNDNIKNNP